MVSRSDIDRPATVMIVDDDRHLCDLFEQTLDDRFDTVTATTGEAALRAIDEGIDVVILDRRLPDMRGEAVMERIHDRGYDPRIAMVTAVKPAPEIISMGFDDYLVKPVEPSQLTATIDRLLLMDHYSETKRQLTSDKLTRNLLVIERSPRELENSEEFKALERRIERLEAELDAVEAAIEPAEKAPELLV